METVAGTFSSFENDVLTALQLMCPCVIVHNELVYESAAEGAGNVEKNRRSRKQVYATPLSRLSFCQCVQKHAAGCRLLHDLLQSSTEFKIQYAHQYHEHYGQQPGPGKDTENHKIIAWDPGDGLAGLGADSTSNDPADEVFLGNNAIANLAHEMSHAWDYDNGFATASKLKSPTESLSDERWTTESNAVRAQNQVFSELTGGAKAGGRSNYDDFVFGPGPNSKPQVVKANPVADYDKPIYKPLDCKTLDELLRGGWGKFYGSSNGK
ncbi:MAG TPA: M91 family zinc metallopeptidase [Tepidisphaeraceae bacterium]|jgi:hypothetical protein|nr:M91 family zinc metallopeptidase [Tepidisphaeraceae bacterium]